MRSKWSPIRGKRGLIIGEVKRVSKKEWEGRFNNGRVISMRSRQEVVEKLREGANV